jgi:glycosyltransferase involved in cell wall biosynthesis
MQSSLPEQLARRFFFRLQPVQRFLHACERWLLERSRLVVASRGLAARILHVVPHGRVREWRYSPADSSVSAEDQARTRQELGVDLDARLVVYCGTFEDYQGLPSLIDARPRVAAEVPGTVLALVGDDGHRGDRLARQAAAMGVEGRIRIVSRQPRERIGQFLAAADVLVSPRAYGGNLPLKVFDYMAAGRPMVVARSAAAAELLAPDRAALVEQSSEAIADCLIEILNDPARAAALGRNAREYAEEHLCWVKFSDSVQELVDVMGNGEPRSARSA